MLDGYKEFLELRRMLFDYFDNGGIGEFCKSYEGSFEVSMIFPCYFDNGADKDEPNLFNIHLDCYVIGPHRHYDWSGKTLKEAVTKAGFDIEQWIAKGI